MENLPESGNENTLVTVLRVHGVVERKNRQDMDDIKQLSEFEFADMAVRYILDGKTGTVGFYFIPTSTLHLVEEHRKDLSNVKEMVELTQHLPIPMDAWRVQPLVEFSLVGDLKAMSLAQGETLRSGSASSDMKFQGQEKTETDGVTTITTECLSEKFGMKTYHHLRHRRGGESLESWSEIENVSNETILLEMITSVNVGHITPFDAADAPERLHLHRLRASWSAEGRHNEQSLEELALERSWSGHSLSAERFGTVGTKPVKKWFPFLALEDRVANVFWGAQLAWAGSWQMEVFRKDDFTGFSAGLADREFGHWMKKLEPGEALTSPTANIAASDKSLDDLCSKLTDIQNYMAFPTPETEKELPVVVNEWCSSWGHPCHDNLIPLANTAAELGCRYLVIDAGWYAGENGEWDNSQGDWIPNGKAFPEKLETTCEAIRKTGMIPGLWFEPEIVGPASKLWDKNEWLLTRDGYPIQVDGRRFLDFRNPECHDYLEKTVFALIEQCQLGYVKIDYNETVGIGADGDDSLGEALRQHVLGIYDFVDNMKKRFPNLVLENCSSGGQRMEPSMIIRSDMTSFSDAHETTAIPIIAANVTRMTLPRLSQIWAVVRRDDDDKRLFYSLAATFMGRMCLSGDLQKMDDRKLAIIKSAVDLYKDITDVIRNGRSSRHGPKIQSYNYPAGWQAVVRRSDSIGKTIVVAHTFANAPNSLQIPIRSVRTTQAKIKLFAEKNVVASLDDEKLTIEGLQDFSGCVVVWND